jgi:hypothetical protein
MIKINEPFYSAYKKYNWMWGVVGIGIADRIIQSHIRNGKELQVTIKKGAEYQGKVYVLDAQMALDISKQYNSTHQAGRTLLRVIPLNEFTILKGGDSNATKG